MSLGSSNLWTKISPVALAEDAVVLSAFRSVAGDNDISYLQIFASLSDAFYDSSCLMTKNRGELSLWVMSIEGVNIRVAKRVCDNLDSDFSSLWSLNLNVGNIKRFFSLPGYSGLTCDCLTVGREQSVEIGLGKISGFLLSFHLKDTIFVKKN